MKRKEWDFWWVLLVCITWDFLKTPGCFFLVGSNYINPENSYGPFSGFPSQISKLSYQRA